MRDDLPTGTVTFLFTDIEGSTALLRDLGDEYADVLAAHHRALRTVWAQHEGVEVDTAGDAFFVAFARAPDAVAAATAAQQALSVGRLRVRIGVHSGEALLTETGYVGYDVHRAARIAAAVHGGQIVVSDSTRALAGPGSFVDLGEHRLKDLGAPERLFQVGDGVFPPLRTLYATNLPLQPAPLIGRERELREVTERLATHRVVTLTGPGGTGKTRLAAQAAAEAADTYADGIWWISLAAVRDPTLVLPAIASSVGASGDLATHLAGKHMLLLLDNLEQVIECAPELAALVASTLHLRLLVTSRQPLRVGGECELHVEPLDEEHSVALFLERARSIDPSVEANGPVAEICRRLDHLPLAVELAAARVRALSLEALLARLDERLPLLTGGRRDAPERQQTLRATIAWTYDLLVERERDAFARLGVFHGGWTLEAAEEVTGVDLELLESLIEKNLVRRDRERYFMLETIREFARSVEPDPAEQAVRHARWVDALVNELEPVLMTADQAVAVRRYRAENDNIRAALGAAHAGGLHELEASIAGACWYFWNITGAYVEGRAFLLAAEQDGLTPPVRARLLEATSTFESMVGHDAEAVAAGEAALALRRAIGDPRGILRALVTLSVALERGGQVEENRKLLEECRDLATETREDWFLAVALTNLGSAAVISDDGAAAERYLRQALAAWQLLGDRYTGAAALTNLGSAFLVQGKRPEAIETYAAVLRDWQELGVPEGLIWCLEGLALAATDSDASVAARLGGAVARACDELGYVLPDLEQRLHDRRVSAVAAKLDAARISSLEDEGRALGLDEAVAYAVASVH